MQYRIISLLLLVIVIAVSCDQKNIIIYNDNRAPGKIKDLKMIVDSDSEIKLTWTASGDDGHEGSISSYKIYYCTDSNLISDKSSWLIYQHPPKPKPPGSSQQCEISGLSRDTTYWYGIRSFDRSGNRSALSNIVKKEGIVPVSLMINSPTNYSQQADLILITVTVKGDNKPGKIFFYGDNQLIDSATDFSWRVVWDISEFFHGSYHSIYATAFNDKAELVTSDTIEIIIDSMLAYPDKPVFLNVRNISEISAQIFWPKSREIDFESFQLSWHPIEDQTAVTDSILLNSRKDTSYTITNLRSLTDYSLTLKVNDRYNHSTSIETSFQTLDTIPAMTNVTRICRTSSFASLIEWETAQIYDFAYYEIIHSEDSIVNSNDEVVALITDKYQTSWSDDQYDFSINNYYSVQTIDINGYRSAYNPLFLQACLTDNWALEFDGYDDYALIPYQKEVLRSSKFTIEMWLRPNIKNLISVPFSQHIDNIEIIAHDSNLRWGLMGCIYTLRGDWFAKDQWVHLALTRDRISDREQLFINGKLMMSRACDNGSIYNDDLFLGCRKGTSYHYMGLIDELRIWNYTRTENEISENYNIEVKGSPEGLVGYWSFNEGGGGVSYSGFGPPARLGQSEQVDHADPVWVLSSVPFLND